MLEHLAAFRKRSDNQQGRFVNFSEKGECAMKMMVGKVLTALGQVAAAVYRQVYVRSLRSSRLASH